MNAKIVALLSLASLPAILAPDEAHADAVGDRVYLTADASTCGANARGFRRIKHMPDGTSTMEVGEFQVPYGKYLEITNIEYTTPYSTAWAMFYEQSLNFTVRQRNGAASTSVFWARYQNRSVYSQDGNKYVEIGDVVGTGAQTQVASFPVGPLMSSAGRLCVAAASNFWLFGGGVFVRGRLIPSGEPPVNWSHEGQSKLP